MRLALFIAAMLAGVIGTCYLADNWPPAYAFSTQSLYIGFCLVGVLAWMIAGHEKT